MTKLDELELMMAARLKTIEHAERIEGGIYVRGICRLTSQPVKRYVRENYSVWEQYKHIETWVSLELGVCHDYREMSIFITSASFRGKR